MIERFLPVLLIIGAIGIFFGYINPTYSNSIRTMQQNIASYDATLKAAADFNQKEAQLAAEKNAIPAESIQRIETYLPDGVDNVQLILDLNALGARSGVQLSGFSVKKGNVNGSGLTGPATDSGSQKVDSLDISMQAVGSYSAFRTFLAGVENSLRPLNIMELSVKPSETGAYTYNLTMRIYWLH